MPQIMFFVLGFKHKILILRLGVGLTNYFLNFISTTLSPRQTLPGQEDAGRLFPHTKSSRFSHFTFYNSLFEIRYWIFIIARSHNLTHMPLPEKTGQA
jgi:hypothetical protein